jgi:hypothetical protein
VARFEEEEDMLATAIQVPPKRTRFRQLKRTSKLTIPRKADPAAGE